MAAAPTGGTRARPVMLTVDDDPEVLAAVERDLRRRYGRGYRVLRADSGPAALDLLRALKRRATPVALLLSDQRMPAMSGVELLREVRELMPDTKAVLLTAYADTEAAIRAINDLRLDHYILKPWDPPEERLYPVLDDLLEEWYASFHPPFEGVRVVGDRWSAESHQLREFLARNQIGFRWLDVERTEAQPLLAAVAGEPSLPLVLLPDGTALQRPSKVEVAEALGVHTRSDTVFFDIVVVGAGPAGLAAAVYGTSEGLKTALVEAEAPGGQAGLSARIDNYLGFPQGVSGSELARRAYAQARRFGAEFFAPHEVVRLERRDPYRAAVTADGLELSCAALIIATGVAYGELEAAGMADLTGRGVYYGAGTTEMSAMRHAHVVIVGGANSAGQAAVHAARYARDVTLVVRAGALGDRMSQYLVEQVEAHQNIAVRLRSEVAAVEGDGHLESVVVCDTATGERTRLATTGMFVFIGARPRTGWLEAVVTRDEKGFVLTGHELRARDRWGLDRDPFLLETSTPGVFAVGDVRARSVKRVASAVGEGSIAVQFVHEYLAL